MRYYDISVPVAPSLPVYEGDPPTELALWQEMARGDLADVRALRMGVHTGTHVDAPAHFLAGGATIDRIELGACVGPALVLDLSAYQGELIGAAELAAVVPAGAERLLLRTRNSSLWQRPGFDPSFVALSEDAATLLVGRGLRLVGIDYVSIAPAADPGPVHRILLGAGVVVLEGLDLSGVAAGGYTLVCLPLRLQDAEAAPARAMLIAADGLTPR